MVYKFPRMRLRYFQKVLDKTEFNHGINVTKTLNSVIMMLEECYNRVM